MSHIPNIQNYPDLYEKYRAEMRRLQSSSGCSGCAAGGVTRKYAALVRQAEEAKNSTTHKGVTKYDN